MPTVNGTMNPSEDYPIDSGYEDFPQGEYNTDLAEEGYPSEDYYLNDNSEAAPSPVLSTGEYEKGLLKQAKVIRADSSLSSSEKKLILDRINKLLHSLQKFPNRDVPPPEVLSEIESFQMDMMDQEAQKMEQTNAQYEELYNNLGALKDNVGAIEGSSYSLTEDQKKDTLTQIDQMMHSLDLGEKPENISKKLEELQTKVNESVVDEKTQTFLNLFTDPPVTVQDLKDNGIFDEIKNNHGEMPSQGLIRFMEIHDSALKAFVTNENYEGAMERVGGLLSEGFGIEASSLDEEEAKDYGLKSKDHLLKIGSKVYAIDLSNSACQIQKAKKMKEADLEKEALADQLANIPGMNDVTAEDILKKAEELGFDLSNFPPSPTAEVFRFLAHISPKLQKAVESWYSTGAAGAGEAMRNALVDGLQILYGKDMVQIDTTSKHCGDDIVWAGSHYDVVSNDTDITIGNYDTYASVFRMIDGDG